ncbi:GerAB/ArcD/ProY family transporter [Bacillus sp. 3255]|uniref:GerAB/ArcD/ProY family transporter n=1 Tax=Bacillus sp. 3255 TaxID=2817904 RepID=UPI0028596BEB|nr:GerAB/ArcD/ProY family transporter [Bacillus sp. 3255]MDR6880378.1 hypothetical protein [Bacillus sp. 3255]
MTGKLPYFQTIWMASFTQTGVIAFSLPRLLSENIGTNGWAALLICSGISMLNLLLIAIVHRNSQCLSLFEIAQSTFPKFILVPLFTALVLILGGLGCMISKEYILILQSLTFPVIHTAYLYLVFEFLAFLLILKGILSISNFVILPLAVTIAVNVTLITFNAQYLDISRMTTFWFKEADHSFKGCLDIYVAFLGYELCLLLFPYVNKKTHLMRAYFIGNAITTFSYILVALICFSFFSFHQLQHLKYPVLNLLSYVELPFVKRIDDLVYTLILFRVLITSVLYSWSAVETMKWLLPTSNKIRWPMLLLGLLALTVLIVLPSTLDKLEKWLSIFGYTEVAIAFILPIFLFISIMIHKYRGRHYA